MKLSILIPSFNESDNIFPLIERIEQAVKGIEHEIFFIDDSNDNTVELLEQAKKQFETVSYHHRSKNNGLAGAIIDGFSLASGEVFVVMDADLQHPPEMLSEMYQEILAGADVVIPSRFIPGGDDGGLKFHRKVVSFVARWIGKLALKKLRSVSDPTGGYFMFRSAVIENQGLKPIGWKILIEVLVRGQYDTLAEIPYQFQPRASGQSKLSMQDQFNYLNHLRILIQDSPDDLRFWRFATVGLMGVFWNMALYSLLIRFGLSLELSAFISALIAMVHNFIWNDKWTWKDRVGHSWSARSVKFSLVSFIGIGINVLVLHILSRTFQVEYELSNLIGIVVATLWNYILHNFWTWSKRHHPVKTS